MVASAARLDNLVTPYVFDARVGVAGSQGVYLPTYPCRVEMGWVAPNVFEARLVGGPWRWKAGGFVSSVVVVDAGGEVLLSKPLAACHGDSIVVGDVVMPVAGWWRRLWGRA